MKRDGAAAIYYPNIRQEPTLVAERLKSEIKRI